MPCFGRHVITLVPRLSGREVWQFYFRLYSLPLLYFTYLLKSPRLLDKSNTWLWNKQITRLKERVIGFLPGVRVCYGSGWMNNFTLSQHVICLVLFDRLSADECLLNSVNRGYLEATWHNVSSPQPGTNPAAVSHLQVAGSRGLKENIWMPNYTNAVFTF